MVQMAERMLEWEFHWPLGSLGRGQWSGERGFSLDLVTEVEGGRLFQAAAEGKALSPAMLS